jgi:hypothetical protein
MSEPLADKLQRATDRLVEKLEFELEFYVAKREGRTAESMSPLGWVGVIFQKNQNTFRAVRKYKESK